MKVGDKVVCISDNWPGFRMIKPYETCPKVGEIYTIREIEIYSGRSCYRFCEIVNAPQMYDIGFDECYFGCENFRPVQYTYGTEVCEAIED